MATFKSTIDPHATDYRSCAIRALEQAATYTNQLVVNGLLNYAAFCMVQEGGKQ